MLKAELCSSLPFALRAIQEHVRQLTAGLPNFTLLRYHKETRKHQNNFYC